MAGLLIVPGSWPVFDANGDPVSGATISFFQPGTSTPKAVYSDASLSTSLGSVLTTNAAGEPTTLAGSIARMWWASSNQVYDIRIQASGLDRTWDGIPINSIFDSTETVILASISDLRSSVWSGTRPAQVTLVNNWASNDGGGVFFWDATSSATDDGLNVVKENATTTGRWIRQNVSLPARLGVVAQQITDWNNATANGYYMGLGAANAPTPVPWYMGQTINHGTAGWCAQEVFAFSDNTDAQTITFRREQNNGAWGSWYPLYRTANEIKELVGQLTALLDIAVLRTATWPGGRPSHISLTHSVTPGDGGRRFYWDATSTASANNGTIVKEDATAVGRWIAMESDIRAGYWGAHPNASASVNRDAIQAAVDWAASLGGGTVKIDIPGYYNVARRTFGFIDRAIVGKKGVFIDGLGTGAPSDSTVALATLRPSEDMTLFIGGDSIVTQTCTISNGSPGVITATAHGKAANDVVYFSSTGTLGNSLPAPLLEMFPYYVVATGLTTNTFRVSLTPGGPAINTTSAGTGTHTLISATTLTHSFGLSNINIFGGATANVQCLLAESTVGAEFDNVLVEPGDPLRQRHGWLHAANFLAAWLNQYTRLQVGGFFYGVGAAHFGSDSSYSQCTFSGCGVNHRISEGSITIDGGQNENATLGTGGIGSGRGLEIVPSGTGRNVAVYVRSRFVANGGDIYIYDSPTGAAWNGRMVFDGVHHDCRAPNISVGSNINNITIDGTYNEQNPPGTPHVEWRGPSTGNVIRGNFSEDPTVRFVNLPQDAQVLSGGNGQQNRLNNLQVQNPTQTVLVREARFELYGSDTVRGQANVAARFGLARNAAGFDAALLFGSLNGNAPFISTADGETTTAASFAINFRGVQHINLTNGFNSFQVPSYFNGAGGDNIFVNRPTASGRYIAYATGAVKRWAIGATGAAEGGSNAGSNFGLQAYDDAGNFLRANFEINRATGEMSLDGIFRPLTDNVRNLGTASFRWATVFAATGTINTSDAREKTSIEPLSEAEKRVAQAIKAGIGKYQWLNAIEAKGADKARIHIGVTAQAVQAAFEAEGLDPWRYAILCADDLTEMVEVQKTITEKDDDGNEVETEVTVLEERPKLDANGEPVRRLGVRYDQLNMFLMGAA